VAAKKKRARRRTPGVALLRPQPGSRIGWRARYRDPDTGVLKWESLPPSLTTTEQREQWAAWKSRELTKRTLELESGAPRATGTSVADAIERYYGAHPQLRERTREIYRKGTGKLVAWAQQNGVACADDLTRAKLMAFRETLITEPKRVAVPGGKRGQYGSTVQRRAPGAINQELRAVRTALGYLRDLDLFPRLTHDDLRRALKRLPVVVERAEYLKPTEIRQLLEAALRHDAATYSETRAEHRGDGEKGATQRYAPIAPFVAFVLITGMRYGEAVALDWSKVDLDARDHDGNRAGEILLAGGSTKTHKARTIGLEVSPALRSMLAALRIGAGGKGPVFPIARGTADAAAKRLRGEYGAPKHFTWQLLRSTCATYLTNAPGIFGASSAYRSAKQLGHSVQVAEKHYTDVLRGLPRDARTLEDAMGIGDILAQVSSRLGDVRAHEPAPARLRLARRGAG
jgi:integrase